MNTAAFMITFTLQVPYPRMVLVRKAANLINWVYVCRRSWFHLGSIRLSFMRNSIIRVCFATFPIFGNSSNSRRECSRRIVLLQPFAKLAVHAQTRLRLLSCRQWQKRQVTKQQQSLLGLYRTSR